jgi:hypothetical protein
LVGFFSHFYFGSCKYRPFWFDYSIKAANFSPKKKINKKNKNTWPRDFNAP